METVRITDICMTDICAWGVFEFMYDVGANNIKVGRDRSKNGSVGSWLAWEDGG